MTKQHTKLTAKERFIEISTDVTEMLNKLNKFHKKKSKNIYKQEIDWGHVGDVVSIAENLESILCGQGIIKEEDLKYSEF